MTENHTLRRFPSDPVPPRILKTRGSYLLIEGGVKLLDMTAGYSACVAVGGNNKHVHRAIKRQMRKFSYASALSWSNDNTEELAKELVRFAPVGLDRVMFAGCSGSEAVEAAMRLSYQIRAERGQTMKRLFITRSNAYHGMTALALSVTSTDVYEFLRPIQPNNSHFIPQHNFFEKANPGETEAEYAKRSAQELEDEILRLGAENVTAFVAETMLGQLQGNVPPSSNYWQRVRDICDRHDVHLVLDEVYCGLGRSGRVYCCEWDNVSPDFIAVGKQLAAGYGPISAVLTRSDFEEEIKRGKNRIFFASTYEAHPLAVAAAIAVQKITQSKHLLDHVRETGEIMRLTLAEQLESHPFYKNVRGRGMLSTIEYDCMNRDQFNLDLESAMRQRGILMQARYHRANFNPPNTTSVDDCIRAVQTFADEFKRVSSTYKPKNDLH